MKWTRWERIQNRKDYSKFRVQIPLKGIPATQDLIVTKKWYWPRGVNSLLLYSFLFLSLPHAFPLIIPFPSTFPSIHSLLFHPYLLLFFFFFLLFLFSSFLFAFSSVEVRKTDSMQPPNFQCYQLTTRKQTLEGHTKHVCRSRHNPCTAIFKPCSK